MYLVHFTLLLVATNAICIGQEINNRDSVRISDIWQDINETTWYESDGFPTLMYVFYEDIHGNRRCIHQVGGSGLLCIARCFVEFSIIGSDTISINDKYLVKDDEILRADGAAWRMYKQHAEVHGATGIVDLDFVKSDEFEVGDLNSGLEHKIKFNN